jgi:chromosome partitioning protein
MRVISLINEKGGIGKTTLAITLATGLATRGHRVVLVDADNQAHSTISLRIRPAPALYNLLINGASWEESLVFNPGENYGNPSEGQLFLLPSDESTRNIPTQMKSPLVIRDRFFELDDLVDVIVVDTSPSITALHTGLYFASHYIIYPTQCEYLSIAGLQRSLEHRAKAEVVGKERNIPTASVLAIVPNMFEGRESVQYQNLGWLKGKYGDDLVWPPIRKGTVWKQASQMRQPVFALDRSSKAAMEADRFVEAVERHLS